MKLTCDICGRTYNFHDKAHFYFYADAPHALLPIGETLGCDGTLRPERPLPKAEIDFRSIAGGEVGK
jgi:hypothetical protein